MTLSVSVVCVVWIPIRKPKDIDIQGNKVEEQEIGNTRYIQFNLEPKPHFLSPW